MVQKLIIGFIGILVLMPFVLKAFSTQGSTGAYHDVSGITYDDLYDDETDPLLLLRPAISQARRENKRVLIAWGTNECEECKIFHQFLDANKRARIEMRENFVTVYLNANLGRAVQDSLNAKVTSIPFVTILNTDGAKITERAPTDFWVDNYYDPDLFIRFLKNAV